MSTSSPPAAKLNEINQEVKGDDEEARAERKRRQRQAQEEFRLRQVQKQQDEKHELSKNASSFDKLLMELPSQDIVIDQTGDSSDAKRKSPGAGGAAKRRASVMNRLDIVQAD